MKQKYILFFLFFISLNFINLISAVQVGNKGTEGVNFKYSTPTNYSTVNTNNSQYLQGLTPSQVANLFNELDPNYFSNPRNYINVSSGMDYTNIALTNQSNILNGNQTVHNGVLILDPSSDGTQPPADAETLTGLLAQWNIGDVAMYDGTNIIWSGGLGQGYSSAINSNGGALTFIGGSVGFQTTGGGLLMDFLGDNARVRHNMLIQGGDSGFNGYSNSALNVNGNTTIFGNLNMTNKNITNINRLCNNSGSCFTLTELNATSVSANFSNVAYVNNSNNFTNTNYFNNVNINTVFNSNFKLSVGGKSNFTDSISTFGSGGTCSGTASACSTFNSEATCIFNSNHNSNCAWNNNPYCGGDLDCSTYNSGSSCASHNQLCSVSGSCTGNVGSCAGISTSYCSYVNGCSVDSNICQGSISSCSETTDSNACNLISGCSYNYGSYTCEGSPYQSCSQMSGMNIYYCSYWSGCSQITDCTGSPYSSDCSSFGYGSVCDNIPSCSSTFSSCNNNGYCSGLTNANCPNYANCALINNYACEGTNSCDAGSSTVCGNEAGCLWNITNPNIKLFSEGSPNEMSIANDGVNMQFNSATGYAYFTGNVSATGFVTRTSVYDKTKGTALSKIQDADYYKTTTGKINETKFYGYTKLTVVDYSKPKDVEKCEDVETCEDKILGLIPNCKIKTTCKIYTIYPYTKEEDGVNLGMEIDDLRQGISDMKTETCLKDKSYSWCK